MKKLTLALAILMCAPLLSFQVQGPPRQLTDLEIYVEKRTTYFRGTWMKGKMEQSLKNYDDADALKEDAEKLAATGYALRDIAIAESEEGNKLYAVYNKESITSKVIITYSWEEFTTQLETEGEAGFSVKDFDHFSYMGLETFIGVLWKTDTKTEIFKEKAWGKIATEIESQGKKKMMILDLDRAKIEGDDHYVVFFTETDKPQDYKCYKVSNNNAFEKQADSKAKKGYIVIESDGFTQGNAVAHLMVLVKQPQPYAVETTQTWEEFQEKFDGIAK